MNTHTQVTPEFRPELAIIDGQMRHDNVIQAITKLDCSPEFNALNFKAVEYTDAKGEKRPCYEITRDGFTFLAMGFTGKQAAQWKEAYILAFNRMESELQEKPSKPTPAPKALPKAKPERRYDYPRRLLEQPHFTTERHAAGLNIAMLGNTTHFVSPLFALLNELRADGHDVSAPWDEAVAMREAIQLMNQVCNDMIDLATKARLTCSSTAGKL
ncbi:MAG: Rha family transcriptional regulator [Methylovulum sp.]|nr:Rha family transcriptional regulator [Methylovulum sp.]